MDNLQEVDLAPALLLGLKFFLGMPPKVHFITCAFWVIMNHHAHSMNPYAVFFFNPVLDYLMRPTITHNLHHAVQRGHYIHVPWSHLFFQGSKASDIGLYNKLMKTDFPTGV